MCGRHTLEVSSRPSLAKNLSQVRLALVSCADTKLVTERHGRPRARHTGKLGHVLMLMERVAFAAA